MARCPLGACRTPKTWRRCRRPRRSRGPMGCEWSALSHPAARPSVSACRRRGVDGAWPSRSKHLLTVAELYGLGLCSLPPSWCFRPRPAQPQHSTSVFCTGGSKQHHCRTQAPEFWDKGFVPLAKTSWPSIWEAKEELQ